MSRLGRLLLVAAAVLAAACGDDDAVSSGPLIDLGDPAAYSPDLDPADFVSEVDNPYLPLTVGTTWRYEGQLEGETRHRERAVLDERHDVLGISAVTVRETVSDGAGEVLHRADHWYAQDVDGNVWYLGEEGLWEAGVDGARPGIAMRADPDVDDAYRRAHLDGVVEAMASIQDLTAVVEVPAGSYDDVLVVEEWSPLAPDVVTETYHAAGVGMVLEKVVAGGEGRMELVERTP